MLVFCFFCFPNQLPNFQSYNKKKKEKRKGIQKKEIWKKNKKKKNQRVTVVLPLPTWSKPSTNLLRADFVL